MKKTKGFTLLELLVVIAIIGLISTFAAVSLNSGREKARDSRRLSDMKQLQTAMEFLYDDNDTYVMADTNCDPTGFTIPVEVSTCDVDLTTYLPNLAQLNDPDDALDICPATLSTPATADLGCNYSFKTAPTLTGYAVSFYLEAASSIGNTGPQLCTLTEDGITCP
jgi:prepilin-type N-terminal cleavage/methylation domain-containing protein